MYRVISLRIYVSSFGLDLGLHFLGFFFCYVLGLIPILLGFCARERQAKGRP
jgi:hypothetical protein